LGQPVTFSVDENVYMESHMASVDVVGWVCRGFFGGHFLEVDSHGSRLPSLTHVNEPQHGGKVPTCEPQELVKVWFIFMKV
jgi:hypothetical protein